MAEAARQVVGGVRIHVSDGPLHSGVRGCDLFHDPRFYGLHAGVSGLPGVFLTALTPAGDPVGVCHALEIMPGAWESPGRGTFGGVQWLDPSPAAADLDACYAALERTLRARGARSLQITLQPAVYDLAQQALSRQVLVSRGYALSHTDVNYAIWPTEQPLRERVNRGKRQMLGRATRAGVSIQPIDRTRWQEAYDLIVACRARRNRPVTIPLASLATMHDRVPGSVFWGGAFVGTDLVGTSILLRVRHDVLYINSLADHAEATRIGVIESLVEAAYERARISGCRLLDYGIATARGVTDAGLTDFKSRMGFSPSERTTWVRTFEET